MYTFVKKKKKQIERSCTKMLYLLNTLIPFIEQNSFHSIIINVSYN